MNNKDKNYRSKGWSSEDPIGEIVTPSYENNGSVKTSRCNSKIGDYEITLALLTAIVVKADNKILQSELNIVKDHFENIYSYDKSQKIQQLFMRILKVDNISCRQVSLQILNQTTHASRLQLIHLLFGIAIADGNVCNKELEVIHQISNYFNISTVDFNSIKAMFYIEQKEKTNSYNYFLAYTILQVTESATNDDIKIAYRKLAKKYHPDKVQYMGEEYVKVAKKKFQSIQNAYDSICKERKIN